MVPDRIGIVGAAIAAASAMASGSAGADAAVRTCTARLTSIAAHDATELGAKHKAISDWLIKAAAAGIQGPTWRLAAERRLICQPVPGPAADPKPVFECIAVGHACAIVQNPKSSSPRPAAPAGKGSERES